MTAPFVKITSIQQLDAMDDALVVAGYQAGRRNEPDYTRTEQDYWHGFNNGQVDGGHAKVSAEQMELVRNVSDIMWRRIFGGAQ